jgi:hypothetical protein
VLPPNIDQEQWQEIGIKLAPLGNSVQFAIGDWWAFGQHTYGSRKKSVLDAAKKLLYEFGSLMNLGWVAHKVPTSCRNEAVSFSHHVEVTSLEPEDQKKWLARAASRHWSVKELRRELGGRNFFNEGEENSRNGGCISECMDWAAPDSVTQRGPLGAPRCPCACRCRIS